VIPSHILFFSALIMARDANVGIACSTSAAYLAARGSMKISNGNILVASGIQSLFGGRMTESRRDKSPLATDRLAASREGADSTMLTMLERLRDWISLLYPMDHTAHDPFEQAR